MGWLSLSLVYGLFYPSLLLTVIGITPFSNSSIAISIGSISSVAMSTGAPMAICSARAPMMRAFSYFVYLSFSSVKKTNLSFQQENGVAEI